MTPPARCINVTDGKPIGELAPALSTASTTDYKEDKWLSKIALQQ